MSYLKRINNNITAMPVSSRDRATIINGPWNSVKAMIVDISWIVMRVINNYIINERF